MTDDALVASLQDAFWREVEILLFHHTNPWELDEVLVAWGFAMGPCEAQDLVGLDVVRQRQGPPVTPVLSRMVAEGRMGKKGGVGFYRYPGRGGVVIDPLIEDLIREEAWFARVERVEVHDDALVTKVLDALRDILFQMRSSGLSEHDAEQLMTEALHFPVVRLNDLRTV